MPAKIIGFSAAISCRTALSFGNGKCRLRTVPIPTVIMRLRYGRLSTICRIILIPLLDGKLSLNCAVLLLPTWGFRRRLFGCHGDGRRTGDFLLGKPHRECLILAKDKCQALVDHIVATRIQVPAIVFQSLQHVAIQPDGDLVALFPGLFGDECCHDFYSLEINAWRIRIAIGFAIKLEGQVRERPTSKRQRTREVSWRIIATVAGVAPAPAPTRRPAIW